MCWRLTDTWVLRTSFVLCLLLMAAAYCRLWSMYDPAAAQTWHGARGAVDAPETELADASAKSPSAAAPRSRGRVSTATRRKAMRYHYSSFVAAFATGAIVAGLLVTAACLDQEALWEALA